MADLDERVVELEVRLAFIDDTVNALSSADAYSSTMVSVSSSVRPRKSATIAPSTKG